MKPAHQHPEPLLSLLHATLVASERALLARHHRAFRERSSRHLDPIDSTARALLRQARQLRAELLRHQAALDDDRVTQMDLEDNELLF